MPFMTTSEMLQRRRELEQHLEILFEHSDRWRRDERTRGAATIENLTQQLSEIQDELQMAGAA